MNNLPPGVTHAMIDAQVADECPSCRDNVLDADGNCGCGYSEQTEIECAAEAAWEAERDARAEREAEGEAA